MLRTRQTDVRTRLSQTSARLAEVRGSLVAPHSADLQERADAAATRLDLVLRDDSLCFHNYAKTLGWLDEADALLAQ